MGRVHGVATFYTYLVPVMEFRAKKAIYLQIAGYASEKILCQQWPPGEKIPSVRYLANELKVSPNMVIRSYEYLKSHGVVHNKRGIGFFPAPDARQRAQTLRKTRFLDQELPAFFKTILLLDIHLFAIQHQFVATQTAGNAVPISNIASGHENQY
jgi:DNA-binding transcriptional regulator YhcF (GntR family)